MIFARSTRLVPWRIILLSTTVVFLSSVAYGLGERSALWRVVENLCLPMHETFGVAAPCLKVDRDKRFVTIRAPGEATHIIVVPTVKIEGVESPDLLGREMPNLWPIAWEERSWVIAAAHRPLDWTDLGMAINSSVSRTQDQLHIHVDCTKPQLKRDLLRLRRSISGKWSEVNLSPWGDHYLVKRIGARELDRGIFQMVAAELPSAREHMGMHSVAVIGDRGEQGEKGFVVFVNGDGGHAEELLDHRCLS
jgi:CDP-diacylglycerol pyrophosphatase